MDNCFALKLIFNICISKTAVIETCAFTSRRVSVQVHLFAPWTHLCSNQPLVRKKQLSSIFPSWTVSTCRTWEVFPETICPGQQRYNCFFATDWIRKKNVRGTCLIWIEHWTFWTEFFDCLLCLIVKKTHESVAVFCLAHSNITKTLVAEDQCDCLCCWNSTKNFVRNTFSTYLQILLKK